MVAIPIRKRGDRIFCYIFEIMLQEMICAHRKTLFDYIYLQTHFRKKPIDNTLVRIEQLGSLTFSALPGTNNSFLKTV